MPINWTVVLQAFVYSLPNLLSVVAAIASIGAYRVSKRSAKHLDNVDARLDGKMNALLEAQRAVGMVAGLQAAKEDARQDRKDLVETSIKLAEKIGDKDG